MSHTNLTHDQEMAVESHTATYWKVFVALLIFTLMEYFYAKFMQLSFFSLVLGLMAMAIIKASLVGIYFMHLKFEGKWVYVMLIPAGILAMVLTFALVPDVVMQPVSEENIDRELIEHPEEPGASALILRPAAPVG
jgi:cytochrome c oxidase subunit 4